MSESASDTQINPYSFLNQPAPAAPAPDAGAPPPSAPPDQPAPYSTILPQAAPADDGTPKLEMDQPLATRVWHDVRNWFTGEDATPDVVTSKTGAHPPVAAKDTGELSQREDLPLSVGPRLAAQYFLTSDPQAVADTAAKVLPGSKVDVDQFGNPTITWNGKTSYINKPGMTAADVIGGIGDVALMAPAGRAINAIRMLGGLGWVNTAVRSAAQGVGQGGVDLARQLFSQLLGSDQPVDPKRVAEIAAGSMMAEPVAAMLGAPARAVGRTVRSGLGGTQLFDTGARSLAGTTQLSDAMLNESGRAVLRQAGVDPSELTVDQMNRVMAMIPRGTLGQLTADSDEARRAARVVVGSARFEIPMTLGQITGDPAELGREDYLRKTSPGSRAQQTVQGVQTQQFGSQVPPAPGAVQTAAENLVPQPPGGPPLRTPAEQGQALQDVITGDKAAQQGAVSAAYPPNLTRQGMETLPIDQQLIFGKQASDDLLQRLKAIADEREVSPRIRARIAQLTMPDGGAQPGLDYLSGNTAFSNVNTRPFNLGDMNQARRFIGNLSPADANEAAVIGQVKDAMDTVAGNAARGGQILGDPDLLARYNAATRQAADFKRAFAPTGPGGKEASAFLDKVSDPSSSGSEIVDALLGQGGLGTTQRTNAILEHLIGPGGMYAQGSDAYEVLRAAAARRVLFGTDLNASTMSPTNISKRITEATAGKGSEIMERLFQPNEMEQLMHFRDTMNALAEQATRNPSGTAFVIADAIKRMGQHLGPFSTAFNDEAASLADARRAAAGTLSARAPRPTDSPIGSFRATVPVAGAIAGEHGGVSGGISTAGTALLHAPGAAWRGLKGLLSP